MSATASRRASGILPDAVIRDPNANAYLIAVTLSETLDEPGVKAWLTTVTGLVNRLTESVQDERFVASVNVAFAGSFFKTPGGALRFGLSETQIPVELVTPPTIAALNGVPPFAGDVLFYVMSTSEAAVAAFQRGLSETRANTIAAIAIEEGFQRADKREQFGFRDGLRNIPAAERPEAVFLDPGRSPEEAPWTAGGSYAAYIKIKQDLDAMAAKSETEQEAIIGRRKSDGSRLDLSPGTEPYTEQPFEQVACPAVASHIRKVGPRGALHDETRIFRRGVPYLTLNGDGSTEAGLQFVSYQRSLDDFAVIFARWMTNPSFPVSGTGTDSLLATGVITIEKASFFFSPAADVRFIGAALFDPAPPDPCTVGRIVVQKELLGTEGQPVLAELGGIEFQLLQAGQPLGAAFSTDSSGRAVSPLAPRGVALTLHEVAPPAGFQLPPDSEVTLTKARQLVKIANHQTPGSEPVYSG
jgi:deferrochelatase/peroxidase EfeB